MITARESSTSSSTCSRDRWHLLPDSRREASESESSTSTARSSRATLNRPVRRLKGLHLKSNSFYEENALPSVTPGPTPGNTRSQQFRPSDVSVTASTLPYAQDEAYSNQRLRSPRFEPVAPTWLTHPPSNNEFGSPRPAFSPAGSTNMLQWGDPHVGVSG